MQKICIVIPCYNEQHRLKPEAFTSSYEKTNLFYLFVNDGSADSTIDVLNKIMHGREDRVFVLDQKKNQGKSEAVRCGILAALNWQDFSIIGYLDCDLATPLHDVPDLVSHFDDKVLFVFGSRVLRIGVEIKRKWYRHLIGRVFATAASKVLGVNVYDTQCGAKFFHISIIKSLFTEKFITEWIFDLEIFFRFINTHKNQNINLIAKEIPLENWQDVGGSKIKFKHLIKIPFEMLKLSRVYKRK
ncbi:MAG: glycosyltransferase [Bacteroidota bacterium]